MVCFSSDCIKHARSVTQATLGKRKQCVEWGEEEGASSSGVPWQRNTAGLRCCPLGWKRWSWRWARLPRLAVGWPACGCRRHRRRPARSSPRWESGRRKAPAEKKCRKLKKRRWIYILLLWSFFFFSKAPVCLNVSKPSWKQTAWRRWLN